MTKPGRGRFFLLSCMQDLREGWTFAGGRDDVRVG